MTTTTSPSSTTVSTSATPTEPAACVAADLSFAKGKGGVGGGSAYYSLEFTNTSDKPAR